MNKETEMTRKQAWQKLVDRVKGAKLAYASNYDKADGTYCVVGHALVVAGVSTAQVNRDCYVPGCKRLESTFGGSYSEWQGLQVLSDRAANGRNDLDRKQFNRVLKSMQKKYGN